MAVSKCPCLTLSRVNVMLDAKISLVPTHQLTVPSTLLPPATNIRTHKATKPQSRCLLPSLLNPPPYFPFPLSHTPYPFQRLLRRLNTPLRIRLLAHNLLAHDKLTNIQYFYCHHHPERSL